MRRTNQSLTRGALLVLALLAFIVPASYAQNSPEALKVEPPNWWANHSVNPVRVLVRGRNLRGAQVEAVGNGISTSAVKVNDAGTYLFVDVTIDASAKPGRRSLRITTSAGSTEAPFEITEPLSRAGRFQGFSSDDVIYLIMPDRFSDGDASNNDPSVSRGLYNRSKTRYYHGGDLQGIINRLPYLKDLGVTAIWLNPWYDNVNHLNEREVYDDGPITDYHGYGAVDFYGVEEHFGTMSKLRELVEAAHRLGLKVIQDQVANHSGPYHPWTLDSPTPTWYNGTVANHINETWQTWTLMSPQASYQTQRETLEGWFIDILPDLNQNDPEASRYIIQNTLWWVGMTGLDAIRQDTLPYVPRTFWRDWTAAIRREYPQVNILGELYDADPALVSFFQGGRARFDGVDSGVDTLFDFPLFYPVRRAFAEGKEVREIPKMLAHDHLYVNPNNLVTFLGLHDMLRFMSEPGASIQGLKLAQTFIMTTRGTPLLYYGDEIAMTGGGDPDNRPDFPGGFPNDPRNAFTAAGRSLEENAVFNHLQRLARLRAQLEPLRRGRLVNLLTAEQQYAYARVTDRAAVVMVFNNQNKPVEVEFSVEPAKVAEGATMTDRLGLAGSARVVNGRIKVTIPARAASVFSAQ
jgi:glycosidase